MVAGGGAAPEKTKAGPYAGLLAVAVGLILAQAIALVALLRRGAPERPGNVPELMRAAEQRDERLAELAEGQRGEFDSHPDAELGHVLLPGEHEREYDTLRVNTYGMREREYQLAKPAGTVRIVLLGDSFVFGWEVAAQERMGARLEGFLTERLGPRVPVEVLHLGVVSWNLRAECAYLRRQLDVLTPDLVVQISPPNDLDDVPGARGFGGMGRFVPLRPRGGDALVHLLFPLEEFGIDVESLVWTGIGYESSSRFAATRDAVLGLVDALGELPDHPRYLLVGHWGDKNAALHAHLGHELDPTAVLYLPTRFREDASTWVKPGDPHWNARGNEQVARLLYGVIRQRELLPQLELPAWPEVEREAEALAAEGWREAQDYEETRGQLLRALEPTIDARSLDEQTARQVFTGLDRERLVSPYASFLLAQPQSATRFRLLGRSLDATSLDGATVHVYADELELTPFELQPGRPIVIDVPLPAELRTRAALNVRLEAEDFIYRGRALRHCVVFQLDRLGLE